MTALPDGDLTTQLARAKGPICWQTLALFLTSRAQVRDQLRIHDISPYIRRLDERSKHRPLSL